MRAITPAAKFSVTTSEIGDELRAAAPCRARVRRLSVMPSFSTLWLLNAAAEVDAAAVVDERARAAQDVPRALRAPDPRSGSPARRTRRGTASRPRRRAGR